MTKGELNDSEQLNFGFPVTERLKSKKKIGELFAEGYSVYSYPFKIIFLLKENNELQPPKVLFSVSAKRFKKATERNKLKRRMREAYRTSKHALIQQLPQDIILDGIAFLYSTNEILPFDLIKNKLISSFDRLKDKISEIRSESIGTA